VASHALSGSPRGAAGAIIGINLGNMMWFALVGAGLSALVAAAPMLFTLLRILGIAYLVYLGIITWRGAKAIALHGNSKPTSFFRGLASAVAVQLSNPKALLFFTVFLPPFLNPHQPLLPQIMAMAAIGIVLESLCLCGYAVLAWRLGKLAITPRTAHMVGRMSGGMLLGAAGALALAGYKR
jgi:homoserine/homoserine lactone efflux protein